jgi:tryptophan synthase beta subunit
VPALESAHAIAYGCQLARQSHSDAIVLVNCSGRGDKDAVRFALAQTEARA